MAKDDERPQFNPKHRIAGAIILVSLAVIFVPMFLDETSPPPENQSLTEIPESDAQTRVVVTPVEPAGESAAAPIETAAAPVPESTAATPPPAETPAKTTSVKASDAPAPIAKAVDKTSDASIKPKPVSVKPSDASERAAKGWVVQVGTFSNLDNAGQLRSKLTSKGFAVDAESLTLDGKKAMRLRVGPYREKSAATKAQAKIEKEFDIHGLVRAFP